MRPVLTLAVADLFGGRSEPVLDLACAVEMVHACSLVLDDLPAMDDAALRRGRPTVHREFGENVALLAALALLNRAYALVAEAAHRLALRRYTTEDVVHHLAAAIGSDGLIGGQALDLLSRPEELDLDVLEYIHSHKTGALFMAAGELGRHGRRRPPPRPRGRSPASPRTWALPSRSRTTCSTSSAPPRRPARTPARTTAR